MRGRPPGTPAPNRSKGNPNNRLAPSSSLPLVRELFERMDDRQLAMVTVAQAAGYDRVVLSRMRHGGSTPLLSTFLDIAQVAGFELVLRPKTNHGEI